MGAPPGQILCLIHFCVLNALDLTGHGATFTKYKMDTLSSLPQIRFIQPPLPRLKCLTSWFSLLNLLSPGSPSTGPEGPKDGGEMEENQPGDVGESDESQLDVLSLRSL